MYRPCRLFPGEIEDMYCTECKQPCSALSLLVGPHCNHPRKRLEEAIETIPHDFLKEAEEYQRCVELLLSRRAQHADHVAAERAAIYNDINAVEKQIEALEMQKQQLQLRLDQVDAKMELAEGGQADRENALCEAGSAQLHAIATARGLYGGACPTSAGMSAAAVTSCLEQLAKCEEQVANAQQRISAMLPQAVGATACMVEPLCSNLATSPPRPAPDVDALLRHVLNHHEQFSKVPVGDVDEEILCRVVRSSETRVSPSSTDDEAVNQISAAALPRVGAASSGNKDSQQSADHVRRREARYIKQYRRLNQCFRDARSQHQEGLAQCMAKAIRDLSRDAESRGVAAVAKLCKLDPLLQDTLVGDAS